jgi:hypothetical protein
VRATVGVAAVAAAGAAAALVGAGSSSSAGPPAPSVGHLQPVAPKVFRRSLRSLPQLGPPSKGELLHPRGWNEEAAQPPLQVKNPLPGTTEPPVVEAADAPAPAPGTGGDPYAGSFAGLDFQGWGAGWPPDTNGDVGPAYFVQAVNTSIGVFRKSDGVRVAAFTFNSLWNGAGTGTSCDSNHRGDPTVTYDPLGDRWFVADFSFSGSGSSPPYYECIAVSRTGDPVSGGWFFYAIRADDASHPWFPDYPKMGIWPDGLYMTANMFQGNTYKEVRGWAFNRSDLESGAPVRTVVVDTNTSAYFSLLPSNMRSPAGAPPVGRDNFLIGESETVYAFDVFRFHVDYSGGGSTFTGPIEVSQAGYSVAASTAPSPANPLDTLRERLMNQAQYTNLGGVESVWVNHTVRCCGTNSPAGIQWAQIDVTGGTVAANPRQQQVYPGSNDGLHRWMGSLAVDELGDMALGYSVSSSTLNPDIRYAGRLAGDPAGTLPQTETTMLAGITRGTQLGNCGGSTCVRWGDYSEMTLDPDGCDFWYTNEYYGATGLDWQTRIGSFRLNPNCGTTGGTSQTISFAPLPDRTYGDPDFAVSATASSGLPVSFSAADDCTVAGNVVHLTGAGSCTITASQPGNATYAPAPPVSQVFAVAKGSQTISFAPLPGRTYGDPDFAVSATASSGLPVSFSASGSCTVSGSTVHLTGAGSCTITASQAGNANYDAAASVARTFAVAKASQTISFAPLPDRTYGDPDFAVSATASSGLPVSFSASGSCTVSGSTVHLTGVGSCTITASQAGNADYQPAADVSQTFAVNAVQAGTRLTLSGAMEGHIDFQPGAWVNGGFHFKLAKRNNSPVTVSVGGYVLLPVHCSDAVGAPVAGTISVPVSFSYTIPARSTSWLPTNDQKSILGWMGAVQAPAFCGSTGTMHNTEGATLDVNVVAGAHTGALSFQFHYHVPAAKGQPNTNCTVAGDPNHNTACSAKWSTATNL